MSQTITLWHQLHGKCEMQAAGRGKPLPDQMQGKWVAVDDPATELIIAGGSITCFGSAVKYDYMEICQVDGALTVTLKVDSPDEEDSFQRANITQMVLTPEGDFHAYNVKFSSQFTRP